MKKIITKVNWPNGKHSFVLSGEDWLEAAQKAELTIPTGCLNGSCGACEIEVNGKIIRACISNIPELKCAEIKVDFVTDPYW